MEIQQFDDTRKGNFFVAGEKAPLAELAYVWAGENKIIIDHTDVGDALRGQHVGQQLVERAVLYARDKGIKIIPLCPFAKSVFDKTPEYGDVLL
jgi:predicted GNAT family acetyltransferase